MCLYPRLVKNPKYKPNKKNGGIVPPIADERLLYVPVGCQQCIECKKKKSREWNVRLQEEVRHDNKATFVTLTFSNESIKEIIESIDKDNNKVPIEGYNLDNEIATRATRLFLERWRKKTGKSIKHWLITELGHEGTENVHIHGLIWSRDTNMIKDTWKYGWVYTGYSCNERTVNYITKYVTKIDKDHKSYNSKILTSSGIGKGYTKRLDSQRNKYNKEAGKTNEMYKDRKGYQRALPIYYRNKIYTEDEREILWLEKLDKMER